VSPRPTPGRWDRTGFGQAGVPAGGTDPDPGSGGGRDSGYVAVLVAIALPLLVVLAALAVDVANWYAQAQKVQQAADAAALAGSVYLPLDPVTARASALDYARRNGYGAGAAAGATVTAVQLENLPSRLQVTITTAVHNVFGAIFGRPTTLITRTAVADYAGPLPMGSACNVFGEEPVGVGDVHLGSRACDGTGDYWLNVAGPSTVKDTGDAYQASVCRPGDDGCLGAQNLQYQTQGYLFVVTSTVSQPIDLSVFDPAFVPVGAQCTDPDLAGAAAITGAVVPDAPVRYATGPHGGGAQDFCTGDTLFTPGTGTWPSQGMGDGQPVTTSFDVRGPFDGTDVASAPVIAGCSRQFKGYGGVGVTLDLAAMLDQTNPAFDPVLASEFRRWVSLCTVQASAGERFVVQIRTNVALGQDPAAAAGDPNLPGGGSNRMALRASGGADTTVAAFQRMSIHANSHDAQTTFYLARVGSGSAGHLLQLSFFDIGDAPTAVSGTLTVLAPPDAVDTATGQPLRFDTTDSQGRALCQGAGVVVGDLPACQVTSVAGPGGSQFKGRTEIISITLPSTYRCNDADPLGCWVTVAYVFDGGVFDTTSWSAALDGDPVRLVQ
jgi:hypothetical protein